MMDQLRHDARQRRDLGVAELEALQLARRDPPRPRDLVVPSSSSGPLFSPEVDCTSPINTSMAYRMMRLRGSFGVTGQREEENVG